MDVVAIRTVQERSDQHNRPSLYLSFQILQIQGIFATRRKQGALEDRKRRNERYQGDQIRDLAQPQTRERNP